MADIKETAKSMWKEVLVGCISLIMASGISYVAWTTHELVKKVENLPDKVVSMEMYEHQRTSQQTQINQLRQTVDNLMINLAAHQEAENRAFRHLSNRSGVVSNPAGSVFAGAPQIVPPAELSK